MNKQQFFTLDLCNSCESYLRLENTNIHINMRKKHPYKISFFYYLIVACVLDPVLQFFIMQEEAFIKLN